MLTVLYIGFALIVLALVLAVYRFWRVHRQAMLREKALATRMMTETWGRSKVIPRSASREEADVMKPPSPPPRDPPVSPRSSGSETE